MRRIKELFTEFNNIEIQNIDNDLIVNKLRKLFERAIKIKMNIPEEKDITLASEWDNYCNRYNPEGVKYTGQQLIRELNKYSHYTPEILTDNDLKLIYKKLNKIFEVIFSVKNPGMIKEYIDYNHHEKLNENQKRAILSDARITFVNAGPGTGKTYLIVHRIIESALEDRGKIIGLSFTNQAAINLKQRLEYEVFGTKNYKIRKNIFIGTIHSFALKSLQDYHENILKKKYDYDIIDELEYEEIKNEFNNNKQLIEEYLTNNKLLTFEQILINFIKELDNNTSFTNYITNSIYEFVIDEAQDLSPIQYKILRKLYDNSNAINLFAVGDPRQNIFGFNGGSLDNLYTSFGDKSQNFNKYNLIISYRCPQKILDFVNSFTFMDCDNVKLKNPYKYGDNIHYYELPNKYIEANKIFEIINNLLDNNVELNQIAILSNVSFYFKEIAELLNMKNVPFKIFGGQTVLIKEIRFILNLLKTIKLSSTYALKKVISYFEPNVTIAQNNFIGILNDTKKQGELYSRELLLIITFIEDYLNSDKDSLKILDEFTFYAKNYNLFNAETLREYTELSKRLKKNDKYDINEISIAISPNNDDFSIFYKKTTDFEYKSKINDSNFITLSTIHSAKGKEWDYIILPGLSQDVFPKYMANDLNAELKKFYVACTRTLTKLYITRPIEITFKNYRGEWTFIKEKSVFLKNL